MLSGKVLRIPVLSSGNRDEERAFAGGAEKVKPFFTVKTNPVYLQPGPQNEVLILGGADTIRP